jgi:Carboxypeptidase regulatory-like domain/Matrixin
MRFSHRVFVVSLLLSIFVCSAEASAYKYRWRKGVITVSVSSSITSNTANIAAGADALATIDRSLAAWQQVANIALKKATTAEQNISAAGAQGDGISLITMAATPENLALFPKGLEDATARTRVFYDARGFITEADIVLNPFLQFSTDGTVGTFDLESTITHEIGHLLGLGHSPVFGATMNDSQGRNGVFNLPAFSARTLAADDIAAIRSLYGPAEKDEDCCGRINGRLTLSNGKSAANFTVWAEDSESGRVLAADSTNADGSFKISGLESGKVELYAQSDSSETAAISAVDLGAFTVSSKQPLLVKKKIDSGTTTAVAQPEYMGLNEQLAGLSVLVNSGGTYDLSIGGVDLPKKLEIGADSSFITIQNKSAGRKYGNGVTTVGFYASTASEIPSGEYSLFIQSESGARRYIIGGLTVEKFPNFWSVISGK